MGDTSNVPTATAFALLADLTTTNRVELSDYGINTLRETYSDRAVLKALLLAELARCRSLGCAGTPEGLRTYLRAARAGSPFRVTRKTRVAIFCHLAGIAGARRF